MSHDGGAPEELADLCRTHHPGLVRALTLQTGSRAEAEDLAQDALERLCGHWEQVCAHPHPERWLYRVALNLSASRWRRIRTRRRHAHLVERDPADDRSDVGPPAALEAGMVLRQAVAALPRKERDALVCRYFLDLAVADTAEVLGCPAGTVKTLTRRALERLRRSESLDGLAVDPEEALDAR